MGFLGKDETRRDRDRLRAVRCLRDLSIAERGLIPVQQHSGNLIGAGKSAGEGERYK